MIRKFFTALLATWLGIAAACADGFTDANRQFASGDFTAAAASYEKLLADQGPDAAVSYNLGNTYLQLKQYGPAILAYERARLLDPRNPDLLANLTRARKAATAFDESPFNPRLEAVITYLSRNEWSWLVAGGALVIGALAILRGCISGSSRPFRRLTTVMAAVAALTVIAGSGALWLRRSEAHLGVVLAENASIRLSPFENAGTVGTPGPGRLVHLGAENAGFHYVSIPGSNLQGWLADKDVAAIVPSSK